MLDILLYLIFAYLIWHIVKPDKNILDTPLFGYSLDYYITKECKPDKNFRMSKYEE